MKTIYIVYGHTGEYADFTEWTVKAFTTEAAANALVAKLRAAHDTLGDWRGYGSPVMAAAGDPNCRRDYTGTWYNMYPLELED